MKKIVIFIFIVTGLFLTHNYASAATIELITNGDFNQGNLNGWTQVYPVSPQEWGVANGVVGGENMSSTDESYFATPWAKGPNTSPTALAQCVDISPYIDHLATPYLDVEAELIYTSDGIEAQVTFYDSSMSVLTTTPFGEYSCSSSCNIVIDEQLSIPNNTHYVEFKGIGYLHEGRWIDSGFDNVSLKVDIASVPIPGALWLLGSGLFGLVAVRRKHNNMS